jgi:hypothetical protein
MVERLTGSLWMVTKPGDTANCLGRVYRDKQLALTHRDFDEVVVELRLASEPSVHLPPDGTRDGDGVWRDGKWYPDHPENHAMLANDPNAAYAALGRVIERHVRWRETAMGFLKQVIDGRGTEDEWAALAEFIEESEGRLSRSASKSSDGYT